MLKKIFVSLGKNQPYLERKKLALIVIVIVGILLVVGLYGKIFLKQIAPPRDQIALPTPIPVPKKVRDLIGAVGQKTSLPQGETPTVATVTDISLLPKEQFFQDAQNGDKVLIYYGAKLAYLYRPSTNGIIQVEPVEIIVDSKDASSAASLNSTGSGVLRVSY